MHRHGIAISGAVLGVVLVLSGCAGGENLYARPLDDFEQAVQRTATATRIYSALARQDLNNAAISALVVSPDATIRFDVTTCAKGQDAKACTVVDGDGGPIVSNGLTIPPTVQMMSRIETYAALLADVAGAVSEAELQARQKSADSALDQLQSGAAALKAGQSTRGLKDFKGAAEDALAGAYLQSQRRHLLTALVKDADPVIAASSKMLASTLGDVRESYLETQSFRLNVQVLNFNNLGPLLKAGDGAPNQASAMASAQVLRRESLSRLVRESGRLQRVARMDIDVAFGDMAKAHAALLHALEFSETDIGMLVEAIENFSASSTNASNALSTLQGMM